MFWLYKIFHGGFFFQCFIIFEYIHSITLVSCPADLENLTQREMLVAVFCWSYSVMGRRVLAWFLRSRRTEMCTPFFPFPPTLYFINNCFWLHFIFIVFFFAHFFVCFICKARVWTEFADPKSWIIYFGLMNSHRIYMKALVMPIV